MCHCSVSELTTFLLQLLQAGSMSQSWDNVANMHARATLNSMLSIQLPATVGRVLIASIY